MMHITISPSQAAFFNQNGYLELEGLLFNHKEVFFAAKNTSILQPFGRDLWRKNDLLRNLLIRKLCSAIFPLLTKKTLRLACDQWMPYQVPNYPCSINDLFCIQGLVLAVIFIASEIQPVKRSVTTIGISPFPLHPSNVLFVKPHIVLDWSFLRQAPVDLYLAAYMLPNHAVYVHNPKDPAIHLLKELGYTFGDRLTQSHFHPFLMERRAR